eukprot:gene8148-8990_t
MSRDPTGWSVSSSYSSPPASVLSMAYDFNNPNDLRKLGKQMSDVAIEAPSLNTRRISANIIIDSPMDVVWSILTDYNHLSEHIPNLVESYLVPGPQGKTRLFQEGAQKIIGFDFRAAVVMDMSEERDEEQKLAQEWKIRFKLVESKMLDAFDGAWTLKYHSRVVEFDNVLQQNCYRYKTKLTYSVFVRPKGPVPVIALEWRIKEDIPLNLYAVKLASERHTVSIPSSEKDLPESNKGVNLAGPRLRTSGVPWGPDETLGSYISSTSNQSNQ